jgi:spermidine synthase
MIRSVVVGCFLMSGAAGLVYEVLWMRLLVLTLGTTTAAVSTILAAFMAGLALGGYVAGRLIDRRGHPLVVYGVLESLVGIYALAVPVLLGAVAASSSRLLDPSAMSAPTLGLVRFGLSILVLLVPTTLMGATLPILTRFVTASIEGAGVSVGRLYGANTLGAAVGAALAGFYFLPHLGIQRTTVVAGAASIGLGLLVFAVYASARGATRAHPAAIRGPQTAAAPVVLGRAQVPLVLGALALSGVAAMVYEVAWTRALVLVVGGTVYAFSVMLVTFLLGLAAGSLLSSFVMGRVRVESLALMGLLQGLTGGAALLTVHLLGELPYPFAMTVKGFYWSSSLLFMLYLAICFAVMFLPTLFLGAFFPPGVRVLAGSLERLGRWVGNAYAVNTVGAIVGVLLAGFVLIPSVGIERTLVGAVALNLALAVALIGASSVGRPAKVLLGAVPLLLGGWLYAAPPRWDPLITTGGAYLKALDFRGHTRTQFHRWLTADRTLLYYRTGAATTVTVVRQSSGNVYLANNGKVDASSHGDMPTQVLLGQLPLLLHPRPESVVVVGLGSGTTAGSVLLHPVRRVVVVELEGAVLQAARFFDDVNSQPLDDPRLKAVTEDGRNYLLRDRERLDVIISEPPNPWVAGVSSLFTKDFFELGRGRLASGGIFCQWLSLDGLSLDDVRSVLKTFHVVFPHVLVFAIAGGSDLVLLGSLERLTLDVPALRERARERRIAADLARVGIPDVYHLLGLLRFGDVELPRIAGDARLNTDDNMLLEFSAPLGLYADATLTRTWLLEESVGIGPYVKNEAQRPQERIRFYMRVARAAFEQGGDGLSRRYVRQAMQEAMRAGLPPSAIRDHAAN